MMRDHTRAGMMDQINGVRRHKKRGDKKRGNEHPRKKGAMQDRGQPRVSMKRDGSARIMQWRPSGIPAKLWNKIVQNG